MLNLQEIVSIATLVLFAVAVLFLWRIWSALRDRSPRVMPTPDTEARTSREVLPLSSAGGGGRVPEVYVYDTEKNTFRRVGLVDASGKGDDADPNGDGIRFVKNKLYRIVTRPQYVAFRPERLVIGKGTTPGGAEDWNVHDIKIGNRSQFVQSGVIPGGIFSADAKDTFASFDTVQTAMDFGIEVSYRGPNESEPFFGSVVGTAAVY